MTTDNATKHELNRLEAIAFVEAITGRPYDEYMKELGGKDE